ncbi:MAG: ATP-binding protein [Eubacteriales bacterium]|nr:ATP-binding protein [Eubacteriales bacterium]
MKEENSKIQGIVNELVSNSLNAKASDVVVHIKRETEDNTVISVKDNGEGMDKETAEQVHHLLNQPNLIEYEDYYGNLTGNPMSSSGLNIVGMLVDEATVDSKEGGGTTITVFRRKK